LQGGEWFFFPFPFLLLDAANNPYAFSSFFFAVPDKYDGKYCPFFFPLFLPFSNGHEDSFFSWFSPRSHHFIDNRNILSFFCFLLPSFSTRLELTLPGIRLSLFLSFCRGPRAREMTVYTFSFFPPSYFSSRAKAPHFFLSFKRVLIVGRGQIGFFPPFSLLPFGVSLRTESLFLPPLISSGKSKVPHFSLSPLSFLCWWGSFSLFCVPHPS